jgi:hypothetical protein
MPRPTASPRDIRGRRVQRGSHVRILKISPRALANLDVPSKSCVRSMIGEIFEVFEIDQYGQPWVEKWFSGDVQHSLSLEATEMELVSFKPNKAPKLTPVRR